jgi:hypothetical protein
MMKEERKRKKIKSCLFEVIVIHIVEIEDIHSFCRLMVTGSRSRF